MGDSVMIVEGNKEYREYLATFFKERDIAATPCATYAAAVKLLQAERFDIAVIDYFIGAMNGAKLCGRLIGEYRDETSLIIMSDRQSPQIEREIRRYAPDFYFVKPFLIDNLHAVVLKILDFRTKRNFRQRKQEFAR